MSEEIQAEVPVAAPEQPAVQPVEVEVIPPVLTPEAQVIAEGAPAPAPEVIEFKDGQPVEPAPVEGV